MDEVIGTHRFTPPPAAPPAVAADPAGPAQWTMDDFNRASNAEVLEAINAGKLRALGVGPPRHHRY